MECWTTWMHRVIAFGAPVVGVVLLAKGWQTLLSMAVPVVLVVTLAWLAGDSESIAASRRQGSSLVPAHPVASIARTAGCTLTVMCCIGAAAALHPIAALLLLCVLGATSPPAREVTKHRGARGSEQQMFGHLAQPQSHPESSARQLTDRELVAAWSYTTAALTRTDDPGRVLGIIITRQRLLDEIWARDRDELETWVAYGARAHDGTVRFFDSQ